MKIQPIKSGQYVMAVSGGVDSMVLLDLVKRQPGLRITIAHYDHGIRDDSVLDRQLVGRVANQLGLDFLFEEGRLGHRTSEALARQSRYDFLERTRQSVSAQAIITAHHQDDVLETAIINILRGTGRKGLTSLSSQRLIIRPMLDITKVDIITYAQKSGLNWREDSTNTDENYLRNYVRSQIVARLQDDERAKLLNIIKRMRTINEELDISFANLAFTQPSLQQLDRIWFISLPHAIAKDFLATWLRLHGINNFDAKILERVVVLAKVGRPGMKVNITSGASLSLAKNNLALVGLER